MKVYAVKFNDVVFLRSYESLSDNIMVTSNVSNIHFFSDYDEASEIAEDVDGYVAVFNEAK
ncbi:hypothetical protein OXT66_03160 [Lentilactobacillus senioris]|uniref:hypothetical protein n=1 Tax=Lentilactobacillus senioris TaxID=931534 RepID=UPI002282E650|nr:hypothetical protein [Lentilactobacillus senioris]MCY9806548.1 hypothetical protein [Lentilactobacillus senioris]